VSTYTDLDPQIIQILVQYERQALVGRLLRGLVHNLSGAIQMVRLPLDLLEIQLKKGGATNSNFTIDSVQEGMAKIFQELELLSAKSAHFIDAEVRQLDLGTLVHEQLEFWRADLFFKHDVSNKVQVESRLPKVHGPYCDVAMAFNIMVEACLEGLRESASPSLSIKIWNEGGMVKLALQGNGEGPSPANAPLQNDQGLLDTKGVRIYLARHTAKSLGGSLEAVSSPNWGMILSLPESA
jgi:C4-dicarboxylate-specific signal transduction histidine kinase